MRRRFQIIKHEVRVKIAVDHGSTYQIMAQPESLTLTSFLPW